MNRREFVKRGMIGWAAAGAMAQAEESAMAGDGGAQPRLTGSFFDLIHVNVFDAAYWTDTCRSLTAQRLTPKRHRKRHNRALS